MIKSVAPWMVNVLSAEPAGPPSRNECDLGRLIAPPAMQVSKPALVSGRWPRRSSVLPPDLQSPAARRQIASPCGSPAAKAFVICKMPYYPRASVVFRTRRRSGKPTGSVEMGASGSQAQRICGPHGGSWWAQPSPGGRCGLADRLPQALPRQSADMHDVGRNVRAHRLRPGFGGILVGSHPSGWPDSLRWIICRPNVVGQEPTWRRTVPPDGKSTGRE